MRTANRDLTQTLPTANNGNGTRAKEPETNGLYIQPPYIMYEILLAQ